MRLGRIGVLIGAVLCVAGAVYSQEGAEERRVGVAFRSYEVWVDGGNSGVAAWQVRVEDAGDRVELVGVEGGGGVWSEQARYDPVALNAARLAELRGRQGEGEGEGGERLAEIVLANLTTGEVVRGRVLVARLNVMERVGAGGAGMDGELMCRGDAAAGVDGERIGGAGCELVLAGE